MTDQNRLDSIEFKLAHLEQAIQQISDVVARQQAQLDTALARAQRLAGRLEELESGPGTSATDLEKPPHY
jgi:uncharacterized coiled-coil protein SlyX